MRRVCQGALSRANGSQSGRAWEGQRVGGPERSPLFHSHVLKEGNDALAARQQLVNQEILIPKMIAAGRG